MATRLFKKGIQNLISGGIDLDTDVIKAWLLRSYTPDTATHATLSAITANPARSGTPVAGVWPAACASWR